jgi:hypothetical protein
MNDITLSGTAHECCPYWRHGHRFGIVWNAGWRGTVWRCICGATEVTGRV